MSSQGSEVRDQGSARHGYGTAPGLEVWRDFIVKQRMERAHLDQVMDDIDLDVRQMLSGPLSDPKAVDSFVTIASNMYRGAVGSYLARADAAEAEARVLRDEKDVWEGEQAELIAEVHRLKEQLGNA